MILLPNRFLNCASVIGGWFLFTLGAQAQVLVSPQSTWVQDLIPIVASQNSDHFGAAVATGDFNRDGFDDLAIGAPNSDAEGFADSGAVFVFYGSAAGLDAATYEIIVQGLQPDSLSEAGDQFGYTLASGDFNADGFDDLAVGSPFEDLGTASDCGAVTALLGSAAGLVPVQSEFFSQNLLFESDNETNDHFGWSLATGDFNADGFDDLVVGAPLEDFLTNVGGGISLASDTGMIGVFFGSAQGLLPATTEVISQESIDAAFNETGDHFGWSLAVGDYDRDGFDDVAVGVPNEDAGGVMDIGMVMVLFGSMDGLVPTNSEVFSEASLADSASETGDLFGWALAAGDFDADGDDDLAVGIPCQDIRSSTNAGAVGVFFGSSDGLLPSNSEIFDQTSLSGGRNSRDDNAGYSLATGDVDHDGIDDLLVGVPSDNYTGTLSNGSVMAVFGSSSGMALDRGVFLGQSLFGGTEESRDEFGTVIAIGDFDANGIADMVIGTPLEDLEAVAVADGGAVYVGTFGDSDGDGLTDLAEVDVFETDPLDADSDGDGMDDGCEWIAGTDPLNAKSVVRVTAVGVDEAFGEVSVTFSSVPGRSYRVERSPVLVGAPWLDLSGGTPIFAGGGVTTVIDRTAPVGAKRLFYRVVALPLS
jgi:hypothetical protein